LADVHIASRIMSDNKKQLGSQATEMHGWNAFPQVIESVDSLPLMYIKQSCFMCSIYVK